MRCAMALCVALYCSVMGIPALPDGKDDVGKECHRWNCPCAGHPGLKMAASKRNNPTDLIVQSARHTREKTRGLLHRIATERFRGNEAHMQALESCVNSREERCLGLHLEGQCRLDGLPLLHDLQQFSNNKQMTRFVNDAHSLLASLAAYVEQARLDEANHAGDPTRSLAKDIQHIEDTGIYHILCSLQISATYRQIPWDHSISRGVMLLGCRAFDHRAPLDNRNYMVFYTLDRLMHRIGQQAAVAERKRQRQQQRMLLRNRLRAKRDVGNFTLT